MTKMLFDVSGCRIDALHNAGLQEQNVRVSVLRLDLLHPVVSGNKLFKLHYFLEEANRQNKTSLLTSGGAFSNHLVATAYTASILNKKSKGIVRGEQPPVLSHTLQACMDYGMELEFVSRETYRELQQPGALQTLQEQHPSSFIIPEGGYHPLGAKGAALIYELLDEQAYTHIALAVGTATTLAGLLIGGDPGTRICAYPALKGMHDLQERLHYLTGDTAVTKRLDNRDGYHFGGYAKHTPELLAFMNRCRHEFGLALDFVYTAKMLYGVFEDIKKGHYPAGSSILCLHTGGLQGNGALGG